MGLQRRRNIAIEKWLVIIGTIFSIIANIIIIGRDRYIVLSIAIFITILIAVLATILINKYRTGNTKERPFKNKLFFCSRKGKPRTDLKIETPWGTVETSNGGLVEVPDEIEHKVIKITIFSNRCGRYIGQRTIVLENDKPVAKVVV